MKKLGLSFACVLGISLVLPLMAADQEKKDNKKFHDSCFMAYEGEQKWPTADSSQVNKDNAVPIYFGLPTQKYTVLGRIYDERKSGFGVVTKAFAEGLSAEKDRQRDAADQAKYRGGDAVIVTDDEKILKVMNLSKEEIEKSAPLFEHKDKVVLVIKFK